MQKKFFVGHVPTVHNSVTDYHWYNVKLIFEAIVIFPEWFSNNVQKVSLFGVILALIFPHSDWIPYAEKTDQNNSEYGHFWYNVIYLSFDFSLQAFDFWPSFSPNMFFFFKTKLWSKIAHNVFHKTIKFVEVPTTVKSSAWTTNFLILSGWSRAVFLKLLE